MNSAPPNPPPPFFGYLALSGGGALRPRSVVSLTTARAAIPNRRFRTLTCPAACAALFSVESARVTLLRSPEAALSSADRLAEGTAVATRPKSNSQLAGALIASCAAKARR